MNRILASCIVALIPEGVYGTVTIASILGISLIIEQHHSLPITVPLGVILLMTVVLLILVPDCVHKNAPSRWEWEAWVCSMYPWLFEWMWIVGIGLFVLGGYIWGITYIGIGMVLASQIGLYGFPYTSQELRQKHLE